MHAPTPRRQTMSRRGFLRLSASGLTSSLLLPSLQGCETESCTDQVSGPARLPATNWLHGATVGGLEVYSEISGCDLGPALDAFASQGVTVVEFDSELSFYLGEEAFAQQLVLLNQAAEAAHARGMRAVAYYPTFEVLSPKATEPGTRTFAKDHPDWLQLDLYGRPNVFIGGGGRVFWVEEDTESAWACPLSDYTLVFLDRVRRLAGTALDGVWPDVPLFADIAVEWCCTNKACRDRFRAETGLEIPAWDTVEKTFRLAGEEVPSTQRWPNFDDPAFRRWVQWRHYIIWEFEQRIVQAAREVRPDFEVLVETVTMDYSGGTSQGLDAASGIDGDVRRVWEVDAASDRTAMREAPAKDWLSMALMMKHGRGCSGPNPSWTFCYGYKPDDAEHVLGLAVATNLGPFELRIPEMTTSVGQEFRRRVFSWVRTLQPMFEAESLARVGVLYSSASRDYSDRNVGVGLYTSLNPTDELWWSTTPNDATDRLPYLADVRGVGAALIHSQTPFDVVIAPRLTSETLSRYRVFVVPSATALSDLQVDALMAFVEGGGTLVTTGPGLGLYDESGALRAAPLLAERLGLDHELAGWDQRAVGAGKLAATVQRRGRAYFRGEETDLAAILTSVTSDRGPLLTTTAPPSVVADVRRSPDGTVWLALANLTGLGEDETNRFNPREASFEVRLDVGTVTSVVSSAPGEGEQSVGFSQVDDFVSFPVSLRATAVYRISTRT